MKRRPKKIAYVINHAAFFVSHRLPLALGAVSSGYDVALVTGRAGSDSMEAAAERALSSHRIEHQRVAFTAAGMNPFVELRGLTGLLRSLRKLAPDVIHCASPKGNLYGAIVARVLRVPALVIAVSGMGFAFTADPGSGAFRRFASAIYRLLARFAYGHRNKRVIVQNTQDWEFILQSGLAVERELILIPGSGVDIVKLERSDVETKSKIVLFAARMVFDKGVLEFIEAARIVRELEPEWKFIMAGAADYENPSSVPADLLRKHSDAGTVDWRGLVDDMDSLYEETSIVCLPSYYREGMPKVLLEAAAAGCAVVTTDLPGCSEAIIPGRTGDLVQPRDARALANALLALIRDQPRRVAYGRAGRDMARQRFSIDAVVQRTVGLYGELLECAEASARS